MSEDKIANNTGFRLNEKYFSQIPVLQVLLNQGFDAVAFNGNCEVKI